MATILDEDFETGANGATVDDTNTTFSSVVGTSITFDNTRRATGSQSARVAAVASSQYGREDFTAIGTAGYSVYLLNFAAPSALVYVGALHAGSTIKHQVRVNADGTIAVRNGTSVPTGGTTTGAMTSGGDYRIDVYVNTAGAVQRARICPLGSTTPLSGGDTGDVLYNQGGTFDNFRVGTVAAATWTFNFDRPILTDTAAFLASPPDVPSVVPQSGSDTFALADGAPALQRAASTIDGGVLTDAGGQVLVLVSVSDAATFAEAATETTVDDGADDSQMTEGATLLTAAAPVVDAVVTTDAAAAMARAAAVADAVAGTGASALAIATPLAAVDVVSASDVAALAVAAAPADSATQTDAPASAGVSVAASDSWTVSDASSLAAAVPAADAATQTDGAGAAVTAAAAVDSATLGEAVSLDAGGQITTSDTTTAVETAAVSATTAAADPAALADASTLDAGGQPTGGDTATITEAAAALLAGVAVADSWTLTDTAAPTSATVATDTTVLSDGSTVAAVLLLAGVDAAAVTEQPAGLLSVSAIAAIAAAALTDAASLTTAGAATDVAALLEVALSAVQLPAADAAALVEAALVLGPEARIVRRPFTGVVYRP